MIGDKCSNPIFYWYFKICWKFISPILLIFIIVISWISYKPLETDGYIFPFYVIIFIFFVDLIMAFTINKFIIDNRQI